MLERSRKLQLRSLITIVVVILIVVILGYLEYSKNQFWYLKAHSSYEIRNDLDQLKREIEDLEKARSSSEVQLNTEHSDDFFESKNRILEVLSKLNSNINMGGLEQSNLDSLNGLSNRYLDSYQSLWLSEIPSQIDENGQEDLLTLSYLELNQFLTRLIQQGDEALSEQLNDSQLTWSIFYVVGLGLLVFLGFMGYFFNRIIRSEFDVCDEVLLQNKINQDIFEYAEKLAGFGHGFYNLNSKKMVFSSNLYRILGFQPKEFAPSIKGYLKHVHPEDLRNLIEALQSLSLTAKTKNINLRIITGAGELKYIDALAILKIENLERILIFVNRDATSEMTSKLKLIELNQDLSIQNRIFWHLEKIASIGYYSIQLDTGSVTMSDNLSRMLGLKSGSDENSKEMLLSLVLEDDKLAVSNWLDPQCPGEELVNIPVRFKTLNGENIFISFSREFFDDKEKILLISLKDVTTVTLINQQLELRNQELFRNNAELASFNHIASHDLQEPLRKIQTFISMIQALEELKLTPKAQDYFFRIQRAAKMMQELILDLLQFSRISKSEKVFEMSDLNLILRNAIEDLTLLLGERKADLRISELPKAEVIPFQIQQLFKNLIENAAKFSRDGIPNTIQIATEKVNKYDLELFPELSEEDLIKITVIDNGIGFNQIHADDIFVIFKRLNDKLEFPGSGIGLAICQKVIENHKGKIFASSSPDEGAKFTFVIPRMNQNGQ